MRLLIILAIGAIFGIGLAAQSLEPKLRTSSPDPLNILGDILFANELPESELLVLLNNSITVESAASASQTREFRIGQSLLFRSLFHKQRNRPKDAERDLEQAQKIVKEALVPENAWGCSLLSDIGSQLMVLRGIGALITDSGSVNDLALKALKLDPQSIVGTIVVAFGKINAPGLFGGNPDLGIDMLTKLIDRSDIQPIHRFTALLGIAEAYKKKNDPNQRQRFLALAGTIYPANPDLQKSLKEK